MGRKMDGKMNGRVYYDKEIDALFIVVKEEKEADFIEVAPGVNVELNENNDIIGIEILNASRISEEIKIKGVVKVI